jgi:hypothetical protein
MPSDFAGACIRYQVPDIGITGRRADLIVTVHDEEENSDDDDGSESGAVDSGSADAFAIISFTKKRKRELRRRLCL